MNTNFIFLFLSSSTIIIIICILTLFLFKRRTNEKKKNKHKYPPSPPSIPIIGNLLWLRKPLLEIGRSIHRLVPLLGPVISLQLGPFPAIFILDRGLSHEALVEKGATFSDRPPFPHNGSTAIFSSNGHIITFSSGSTWRLLRRNLTSEILHPSCTKTFAGGRKWVMGILIKDIEMKAETEGGRGVPVLEIVRKAIFRLLVFMCFGEKVKDEILDEIVEVQNEILRIALKLSVFDLMPVVAKIVLWRRWRKFLALRRRQAEVYTKLIRARREVNAGGGLISYVDSLLALTIPEEGGRKLTEDEMVSLISEFFNAGVDTTTSTMEWAMANLIIHQSTQIRLLEEITTVVPSDSDVDEDSIRNMPYLKAVIFETLRRHPPVPFLLPHATNSDAKLGPYYIPKGSVVNVTVEGMGMDGVVWEGPAEFRPERFLVGGRFDESAVDLTGSREIKMMPFGAGRRICPGLGLALLHLEYFLANLVREFEWTRIAADDDGVDLSAKMEFSIVMKNSLRARVRRRRR